MQSEYYEPDRKLRPGLRPGERIDPETGAVLYSAAWLGRLSLVPDPLPHLYDVRVIVYPARDPVHDDYPPGLVLFTEVRVAAPDERRALDQAVRAIASR